MACLGRRRASGGQTVLIHAASGGVGSFAVQMAKNAGAKVIATASAARRQHVLDLGADTVVVSIETSPSQKLAAHYGVRAEFLMVQPDVASLAAMAQQFDAGLLKVDVCHRFALHDAASTQEFSQSGRATGRIVIEVAQ